MALLRELPERMRSQRIKVGAGQDDVSNTRGNTAARSSVVGGNTAVPIGQRIQCCSHAVQKLLLHMVLTHKRSIDPEAPPEDLNFAAAVRYLGENGVIYSSDEQPCREYQGRRQQGKPRTTPHHADRSQRHSVVHSLSVHQCLRDASTRKVSHTVCW